MAFTAGKPHHYPLFMNTERCIATTRISCVIPGLNESRNLQLLLPQLSALLQTLSAQWEIIVVDDGSSDDTPQLMAQWCRQPGFAYIQLSRNFGKEAALSAGLAHASGDVVVLMDADMQHPTSLIPQMLARWQDGVDNVYALRENRDEESRLKRWGSNMFYRLLSGSRGVKVPPNAGDFRLMDRQVVDALLSLPERTRFMKGLYAWVGFSAEPILYTPHERVHGHSQFSTLKLVRLALDGLTAFTTWPLRMVSSVGSLLAVLAFGYGLYLVGDYLLNGNRISGWTTIATLQLFFSGIILVSIGIVGDYLSRVFDEVKQRPLYLIRQMRSGGMTRSPTEKNDDQP